MRRARKPDPCRTCRACNQSKPLDSFALNVGGKGGRRSVCRVCVYYRKKSAAKHPLDAVLERRWKLIEQAVLEVS